MFYFHEFQDKFCNNKVYQNLASAYQDHYPHIPQAHVAFLVREISWLLVHSFCDCKTNYISNVYKLVVKIFHNNSSHQELERFSYEEYVVKLHAYWNGKDIAKKALIKKIFVERKVALPTEEMDNYIPFVTALLINRAGPILTYVHNYLISLDEYAHLKAPPVFLTSFVGDTQQSRRDSKEIIIQKKSAEKIDLNRRGRMWTSVFSSNLELGSNGTEKVLKPNSSLKKLDNGEAADIDGCTLRYR